MRSHGVVRSAIVASALWVGTGSVAYAQDATPQETQPGVRQAESSDASTTQVAQRSEPPTPGVVIEAPQPERRNPRFDIAGGYESDSQDTSYAFFGPSYNHPLSDNLSLTASVRVNHLQYEFENSSGGRTEVEAPGISPGVGLRWGGKNWVKVTTGLSIRQDHRTVRGRTGVISDVEDTRVGLSLGADGWWNPSRRSNVHAMVHYGAVSQYVWSRLAAKHQISNFDWRKPVTLYLGAEGVAQGNEDIRSYQLGPLVDFTFGRSQLSLTLRAGYKHSSYEIGPDDSGPYFGIGLWKRL